MKNILIIVIVILLYGHTTSAQSPYSFLLDTKFSMSNDSINYHFNLHSFFSLGFLADCPKIVGYDIHYASNSVFINAYYDVTGAWPLVGCDSRDTINYVNSNRDPIWCIYLTSNLINYDSINPTQLDTFIHIFDSTICSSSLHINEWHTEINDFNICPNPTSTAFSISNLNDFDHIMIYDLLGNELTSINVNKQSNLFLNHTFESGIYIITATNKFQRVTKKLFVQ